MTLWQGRFGQEMDPVFEKMNRSLGIDAMLLEVDIRASRAHAQALLACGVLTQEEWQSIDRGLSELLTEYSSEQVRETAFEDIHTFVEATLAAKIGAAARKLHTGRSRNDQVATDMRMFVKEAIELVAADIEALQLELSACAEKNPDVLVPAYTHLRRAQPITWKHYCRAFIEMFGRDCDRFRTSITRVDVLPLGSGAVAGSNFPLDREAVARNLGFAKISANSLDATSDRDFVLEFLSNASLLMIHASRLAEDWILYSSEEFGFIELSEKVTTGSSLMPQKKNPDSLELTRAKAGTTIGLLTGFLAVMKGLPTGYDKDLQEDKQALFTAFETVRQCLSVLRVTVQTVELRKATMRLAASDPFMGATDLADFLVTKRIPFRNAHEIVAHAVRFALEKGKKLDEIDLADFSSHFAELPPGYLLAENIVKRKSIAGGTGAQR